MKMASLVPEKTPWGDAFNKMAADWSKVTNGEVELIVYHGSVTGKENDTLRKLKGNQIQVAVLSSLGLRLIAPEIMAITTPFLIRDNTELDMVLKEVKSDIEKKISENGFHTIGWSKVGWVKFFSKAPVFIPSDIKKMKLATDKDQPELMAAFKSMGYQMVPMAFTEVLIYLNGGMIDALYQNPATIAGLQIFGLAKNMASINVAPFMGTILMNDSAWRSIPDKYKPELIKVVKKLEADLDSSVQKFEASTIDIMKQYGLVINNVSPQQEQIWYDDMEKIGLNMFSNPQAKAMYAKIGTLLKNYRANKK
ncbi:MAG: hypothetical protein Ta2G_05970 [Termitinemataceae bacterium]|nr:MAG: hypothetical protein Ta2G_05970 [Termitinemataceae bacterium]